MALRFLQTTLMEMMQQICFHIWNFYQGERTISYEVISKNDVLEAVHVARGINVKKSTVNGVTTITYTPDSSVTTSTGNNTNPAASIYQAKKFGNEFVKIGFTALNTTGAEGKTTTMTAQGFAIGLRKEKQTFPFGIMEVFLYRLTNI